MNGIWIQAILCHQCSNVFVPPPHNCAPTKPQLFLFVSALLGKLNSEPPNGRMFTQRAFVLVYICPPCAVP